ncbi:unnamed protein product [Lampetra planeri]
MARGRAHDAPCLASIFSDLALPNRFRLPANKAACTAPFQTAARSGLRGVSETRADCPPRRVQPGRLRVLSATARIQQEHTTTHRGQPPPPALRDGHAWLTGGRFVQFQLSLSGGVGGHSFSSAAPIVWNSLPNGVRAGDSLHLHKSKLKSLVFSSASGCNKHVPVVFLHSGLRRGSGPGVQGCTHVRRDDTRRTPRPNIIIIILCGHDAHLVTP